MIADKKLESLDHSSARLTVTVDKDAARKEYDALVQKYSKTARIKGFRRGKIPPKIIEQKFGENIRTEAGLQLIESSLKEVFAEIEEKPLPYEPPALQDGGKLQIGTDFTFTVTYDVFPEIAPGAYKGVEVEQPIVSITAADVERELEQIRLQNAIVADKDGDAPVEKDDIVTVDYAETDADGNPIEGTERRDFIFTVGTGYNRYKIDDDIVGMKREETRIVEKHFDDDFEDSDLAGRDVRVSVKVTQIKSRELPELDDELAQDVSESYQTLDDLKKDIRTRLQENADARIRGKIIGAIIEKAVEEATVELPESMIRAELESYWQNSLSRSGVTEEQMLAHLEQQNRTREQMLDEWREEATKNVRTRLVLNRIMEIEHIVVEESELEEAIKEQAERGNTDVETARQNIERANMLDYLRRQIAQRKLADFLYDNASIKKGKKTALVDLLQDNQ